MKWISIILTLLAAFPANNIYSQEKINIKVSTKVGKDSIYVGEVMPYSVTIISPRKLFVKPPVLPDSIARGVESLGNVSFDTLVENSTYTYTYKAEITSFESGVFVVPRLPFVIGAVGPTDTILSDSVAFASLLVPRDSTIKGIYDIHPPISEPLTFSEVAPWAGLGLLIILIAVLIIMYVRTRKQNKPFFKLFKPAEPAHVIALRELNKIKDQKLWASENHKEYYTKVIDVIRNYIKRRFGFNAPEMTSSEILAELSKVDFDFSKLKDDFIEFLSTSDLVKFAKHAPLINDNERFLDLAFNFVNSTKVEEENENSKQKADEVSVENSNNESNLNNE